MIKKLTKEHLLNECSYLYKSFPEIDNYLINDSISINNLIELQNLNLNLKLKLIRQHLTLSSENFEFAIGIAEFLLPKLDGIVSDVSKLQHCINIGKKYRTGELIRIEYENGKRILDKAENNLDEFQNFNEFKERLEGNFGIGELPISETAIYSYYEKCKKSLEDYILEAKEYVNICEKVNSKFPSNWDISTSIIEVEKIFRLSANLLDGSHKKIFRIIVLALKLADSVYAEARIVDDSWKEKRKKFKFLDQDSCEELPEINREKWASLNTGSIFVALSGIPLDSTELTLFNKFLITFLHTH